MLDTLRTASTGWLAKVLIGLLVASFAVWGISGSIFYGSQNTVVEVGETTVSTTDYRFAYENQLLAFSQQIGRRLSRQEADTFGLRQSVLQQVTAGALLDETARRMGLGVSETNLAETIASDPTFNDLSGNFSRSTLRATLRRYGISEAEYIESRKRVALRNQLQDGTSAASNLPDVFADALTQFSKEERVFKYVEFGPEIIEDTPEPSHSELQAYYDESKARFTAPEYREVNYIKLQASDLARPDEVTEEDIRAEYDGRKDRLRTPERRTIDQLVFADADEANTISEKLKSGASFETVVKESGRTLTDLSLGTVTRTELPDDTVAEAAFSATLNKPTETVEGLFGPVILRVTNIEPEKTTAYQEIKDRLKQDIALRLAGDRVFELFDLIEDELAAGEGILETANRLEIEARTIPMIDSNGDDKSGNRVAGVPIPQELARAAFEAEPGDDTEALELRPDGFLWYETAAIIPAREKPLEEIEDAVQAAWVNRELSSRVKERAEKIAGRVRSGENFNAVLAELLPADSLGIAVQAATSPPVMRAAERTPEVREIVTAGFDIGVGEVTSTSVGDGQYAVIEVLSANMSPDSEIDQQRVERIKAAASSDVLSQVVGHLQSRETVRINQAAIEAAFNPAGGGARY